MNILTRVCCAPRNVFPRLRAFRFTFFRLLVLALLAATAIQARAQTTVNLTAGWNLLGSSNTATMDVAATFGDAGTVTTVWKWVPATSKWAFYAPSMTGTDLAAYAAGKGYSVLSTITGGEGFWVNAKTAFAAQLPAGAAVQSASFRNNMAVGWNLIAIGDNKTPSQFNIALSPTLPATGVIPENVTTLWAWNLVQSNWYFYAPSLDANGTLAGYVTTKGYLNFASTVLGPTVGFWVNVPAGSPGVSSVVGIWKYSVVTPEGTSTAILTLNADRTFTEEVNIYILGLPGGCSYAGGTYVTSGNTITTVNKPTSATPSGMMPATSCNTTGSFKDATGTFSTAGDTLTLTDASGSVILVKQ